MPEPRFIAHVIAIAANEQDINSYLGTNCFDELPLLTCTYGLSPQDELFVKLSGEAGMISPPIDNINSLPNDTSLSFAYTCDIDMSSSKIELACNQTHIQKIDLGGLSVGPAVSRIPIRNRCHEYWCSASLSKILIAGTFDDE